MRTLSNILFIVGVLLTMAIGCQVIEEYYRNQGKLESK